MVRPLFTSKVTKRLQAMSAAHSPSTAIVTTPVGNDEVDDGEGGWEPGATVVYTYAARVAPVGQRTAQERLLADRYTDEELSLIILPWNAVVAGDSTILLDGVPYDVVGLLPLTSYPSERKVIVRATGADL